MNDNQTPDTANPRKLAYNIDQAAEAVGVSRRTIYSEVKAGHLWTFKAAGRTLILADVLRGYVERQAAASRPLADAA